MSSTTASPISRFTMIVAAALCVAVAAVHVDDQGGITAFADPDWFGWAYRLIELGSIVVAGALVFAAGAALDDIRAKLVWVAAALVGVGPFAGYLLTRTTGLPGDSGDIGNWADVVGTVSLVVEALLVLLAVSGLLTHHTTPTVAASRRRVRALAD